MFLHENEWLEVSVDMDSVETKKRIDLKIKNYRKYILPKFKYSSLRLEYLKKTILFLRDYGEVYLIRLPIHERMMEVENELMPDFNRRIQKVINLANGYYDMTSSNSKYNYTDGNHLYKDSGRLVTKEIINWIQSQ